MPWKTPKSEELVKKAISRIQREFPEISVNCSVYVSTKNELEEAIIQELKDMKYSKKRIQDVTFQISFVIGKYFETKNTIWILQDKGETIETIIHELLHSIQKCKPHREGIVNYLTFKLTGSQHAINDHLRKDWEEIEKTNSFELIKSKLLSEGDCEDF